MHSYFLLLLLYCIPCFTMYDPSLDIQSRKELLIALDQAIALGKSLTNWQENKIICMYENQKALLAQKLSDEHYLESAIQSNVAAIMNILKNKYQREELSTYNQEQWSSFRKKIAQDIMHILEEHGVIYPQNYDTSKFTQFLQLNYFINDEQGQWAYSGLVTLFLWRQFQRRLIGRVPAIPQHS